MESKRKKALLIAEKPSLMRDIQRAYNSMNHKDDIDFVALVGHVLTLKEPDKYKKEWGTPWKEEVLPIIPDKWEYEVRVKDVYSNVEKKIRSGKYDYLINACDAGREGQLIFHSVYSHVGVNIPVKRLWSADQTTEGLQEALNNLLNDKSKELQALTYSSALRARFDWLIGMNLSRAVTLKTGRMIPIGRVMTPTLNIVVERENEIKNFKSKPFYEVEADFGNFKALRFEGADPKDTRILEKNKANNICREILVQGKGQVLQVKKTTKKQNPFMLHSLTELQKEANRVYGFTANKTLSIAQSLYQDRKLITYPRTDSRHLPKNMAKEVPARLEGLASIPFLKPFVKDILKDEDRLKKVLSNKRYVNNKKVTDHFAIIPTKKKADLSKLSQDEARIYTLIARRLVSIFLPPQITETTNIISRVGNHNFITNINNIKDKGFMIIYKDQKQNETIPDVKKGDKLNVKEAKLLEGKTTPPARYTESSLLSAMENAGRFIDEDIDEDLKKNLRIGTVATSASIIEKLVKQEMIKRQGKSFIATDFGMSIIEVLKGQDVISPELTAKWESKLTDIEDLKHSPKDFNEEMTSYIELITNSFLVNINKSFKNTKKKVLGSCPHCGKEVILGKNFYLCEAYKKTCDFIISKKILKANINQGDVKDLLNGKKTKTKTFTWNNGKEGQAKLFYDKEKQKLNFVFED